MLDIAYSTPSGSVVYLKSVRQQREKREISIDLPEERIYSEID